MGSPWLSRSAAGVVPARPRGHNLSLPEFSARGGKKEAPARNILGAVPPSARLAQGAPAGARRARGKRVYSGAASPLPAVYPGARGPRPRGSARAAQGRLGGLETAPARGAQASNARSRRPRGVAQNAHMRETGQRVEHAIAGLTRLAWCTRMPESGQHAKHAYASNTPARRRARQCVFRANRFLSGKRNHSGFRQRRRMRGGMMALRSGPPGEKARPHRGEPTTMRRRTTSEKILEAAPAIMPIVAILTSLAYFSAIL